MGFGYHPRTGRPGWRSSEATSWWLTGIGLVPLFIAGVILALGAIGVATGATEADEAWAVAPVVVVFGVLIAAPALGALVAPYLLALRLSLRSESHVRARARALALSPILVAPWMILSTIDPGEWAGDKIAAAPVLLAGALLYACVVPLPGAPRETRARAFRQAAMGVLGVAAALYLTLGLSAAF